MSAEKFSSLSYGQSSRSYVMFPLPIPMFANGILNYTFDKELITILTITVKGDKVQFKLYSNLMNAFKLSYSYPRLAVN